MADGTRTPEVSMGKKFRHDPVYKDVEILNRTGFWPKVDGESCVPAWALERAKAWQCSPACGSVIEDAMKFEIRRLRRELRRKEKQ
jgi:hypothetical protein